jgi:hypothetical protein
MSKFLSRLLLLWLHLILAMPGPGLAADVGAGGAPPPAPPPEVGDTAGDSYASLWHQFPSEAKAQCPNLCSMHAVVKLVEAALYRLNPGPRRRVLDNDLAIYSFYRSILDGETLDGLADPRWLLRQKAMLGLNLYFFERAKMKTPFDFGFLDRDTLAALTQIDLFETGFFGADERMAFQKQINDGFLAQSREFNRNPPPKHPARMSSEEIVSLPIVRASLSDLRIQLTRLLVDIGGRRKPLNVAALRLASLQLAVDEINGTEPAAWARERLKAAERPFSRFSTSPASESEKAELDQARVQCSRFGAQVRREISALLKSGVPVAVGLFAAGLEFGRERDALSRVYLDVKHAMVLASIEKVKNENGVEEAYYYFLDSSLFNGSQYARMPARESCRILAAVALLTPSEAVLRSQRSDR